MQDFRNLKVWQKAHALTLAVYHATAKFPADERFGLTIQLRRSATLIPTNIAEGCGRGSDAEFWKLLSASLGVANQLEYQLLLAKDLGFLQDEAFKSLTADVVEVRRMITGLIQTLHC
jgi:four helix bundle protein